MDPTLDAPQPDAAQLAAALPPLWDQQPPWLTTRQAAALLGKTPANVRARASKGDFGATQAGPDGLPRYQRERVRAVAERMAARQARSAAPPAPPPPDALPPAVAALLTGLEAQRTEHTALCDAWIAEARDAARQARAEAEELRALLRAREETTRETLSHMDLLHDQNIRQARDAQEREREHWAREVAAKDAEIERLKAPVPEKRRWGK